MIRQMKIYSTYLAHFLISAFQTSKSLSLLTRNSIMMFSKVYYAYPILQGFDTSTVLHFRVVS